MRKTLSLILTVFLVLSMIAPANVFATEPIGTEGTTEATGQEPACWTISGTVLDEDGQPLEGVELTAAGDLDSNTAYSMEDGSFAFTPLPEGEYILSMNAGEAYAPYSDTVSLLSDVELEPVHLSYTRYTVTVTAINAAARWELSGLEPGNGDADPSAQFEARRGDSLSVSFDTVNGCTLDSVTVNGVPADLSGNSISLDAVAENLAIVITGRDDTAPVFESVEITDEIDWAKSKTVTLTVTDNVSSGANLRLFWSENEYETVSAVLSFATEMQDGQYLAAENKTVHFYAVDEAGNLASTEVEITKIDTEAPGITDLTPSTTGGAHEVVYTFHAQDNGELESVSWTNPAGEVTELALSENGNYMFTLTDNGSFTVTAVDKAGNSATLDAEANNIDWDAPAITVVPQNAWNTAMNVAQITITDASQLASVFLEDEAGNQTPLALALFSAAEAYVHEFLQNGRFWIVAADEAGNEARQEFFISYIDTEDPVITHIEKYPEDEWTAEAVSFTVDAEDSQSGVKVLYYTLKGENESNDLSTWTMVRAKPGESSLTVTVQNNKDRKDAVRFVVEDGVGRVSGISEAEFAIDVSSPEQFAMAYDRGEDSGFFTELENLLRYGLLYKDYITVTAEAEDLGSGVDRYEYQLVAEGEEPDEDAWQPMDYRPKTRAAIDPEEEETEAFAVAECEDFLGCIYVRVWDKVGNVTEAYTDMKDDETVLVVLENTPKTNGDRYPAPVLSAVTDDGEAYKEGAWTNRSVTVIAEAEEPAVSGVKRYEYQTVSHGASVSADGWKEAKNGKTAISTDSNVDVWFRAVSYAENPSKAAHMTVRVQKTKPENAAVSVTGKQGLNDWFVALPEIRIAEYEPASTAAPVSTWYSLVSSGEDRNFLRFGENAPVVSADGVYELAVRTADAAGNVSETYSKKIYVDTTAPTSLDVRAEGVSILAEKQGSVVFRHIYSHAVTATASANCDVSGLLSMQYQKVYSAADYDPNGSWTTWPDGGLKISPNDNCLVYLKVTDRAGNFTVVHTDGLIMDDTAPSGIGTPELTLTVAGQNQNGWFAGDGTVEVSIQDPDVNNAYSGLSSVTYQVVTEGVTTQNETIYMGESGDNIRQTAQERGNNNAVRSWSGKITVKADRNNSDNIVVRVTAVDRAGNSRTTETRPGAVKIDTTAPTAVLSFDNNSAKVSDGKYYFDADRTLTIRVTDRDLGANALTVTKDGEPYSVTLNWDKAEGKEKNGDDSVYTAKVRFDADGEYTLSFEASDLAGNKLERQTVSAGTIAPKSFVLDKTAPTVSVRYDNNDVKNDRYFDAARTAVITVTDANFDPDAVTLSVSAALDGKPIPAPQLSAWTHSGDTHKAELRYADDGDYAFSVSCKDRAGNGSAAADYSGMKAPTSFTVDTKPVEVKVDGLEEKCAYPGHLSPVISYSDVNFSHYSFQITRNNMAEEDVDMRDKVVVKEEAGVIRMEIPEDENMDGIYRMNYSFEDKAGHVTEQVWHFTVNRNGSVFEYSPDLVALLNSHVQAVEGEFKITEYNPSPVEKRTVAITVDGEPITDVKWNYETVRDCGFKVYIYEYIVSPANFIRDGQYRITVATEDGAENHSEATPDILFWKDTTKPEIPLITGMEESIVNAPSQDVVIQLYDTIGLANVKVVMTDDDGVETTLYDEAVDGTHGNAEIKVTLPEGLRMHLRVIVTDLAGNVLDTDAENYNPAFEFADEITVSENLLTRWYANPWVFYGSLGLFGAAAATGASLAVLAKKRKKERKDVQE